VVGVAVAVMLAGCSEAADPLSGKDATPGVRTAVAETVDVCDLIPPTTASRLLERAVVGRTAGAARNPTVTCDIGERFGEPIVSVSLAPDPIAKDVFDAAYGERAGGNPSRTELGEESYVRTEDVSRVIHVFEHGAVVSVRVPYGPPGRADEITLVQFKRLARSAVEALPENPVAESSTAPAGCDQIDATALAETLGRPPTLDTGLRFNAGSLLCSWSGQPGSVTLSMTDDSPQITRFLDEHPLSEDVRVPGVLPGSQGRAYSSPSAAGDLVVVLGDREALMTSQVIPAAGYADDGIDTSESERVVAQAGLTLLSQLH
jgi:hypothetical protein